MAVSGGGGGGMASSSATTKDRCGGGGGIERRGGTIALPRLMELGELVADASAGVEDANMGVDTAAAPVGGDCTCLGILASSRNLVSVRTESPWKR